MVVSVVSSTFYLARFKTKLEQIEGWELYPSLFFYHFLFVFSLSWHTYWRTHTWTSLFKHSTWNPLGQNPRISCDHRRQRMYLAKSLSIIFKIKISYIIMGNPEGDTENSDFFIFVKQREFSIGWGHTISEFEYPKTLKKYSEAWTPSGLTWKLKIIRTNWK